MSVKGQVILVSVWYAGMIAACASTIWGRMAERDYKVAMWPAFRWMLIPPFHRLREKEAYIRFQKGIAWFGLFFVTFVYAVALVSIVSHR